MSPLTQPDLKPSEAIRAGLKHPDYTGQIRMVFCNGQGGYCASGVAMLGYGLTPEEVAERQREIDNDVHGYPEPFDVLPDPLKVETPGPLDPDRMTPGIGSWIISQNDGHGMTIEQIADELERIGL